MDERSDSSPKAQLAPAVSSAPHAPGLPAANCIFPACQLGFSPLGAAQTLPIPWAQSHSPGWMPRSAAYSPTSSTTRQNPVQPLGLNFTNPS